MLTHVGRRMVVLMVAAWTGSAAAGPITDIVTVDGREWAQVDLFENLSWNDVNAVCPGGVCGSGTLNGFDMSGWTWASTDDLNNLFNYYFSISDAPPPPLGPGPDDVLTSGAGPNSYAGLFFADGWRANHNFLPGTSETIGRMSDSPTTIGSVGVWIGGPFGDQSLAGTNYSTAVFGPTAPGAWFSREAVDVPSPGILPLLGLGIAALGFSRRAKFRGTRGEN